MKMKSMGSVNEAVGAARRRKSVRKPAIKPLSRTNRMLLIGTFGFAGMFVLFNAAAGLSPMVTGRCLKCVITGNYHCRWLPVEKHPSKAIHAAIGHGKGR